MLLTSFFFICTVFRRDASVAGGHGCWATVCLVYGSRSLWWLKEKSGVQVKLSLRWQQMNKGPSEITEYHWKSLAQGQSWHSIVYYIQTYYSKIR